MVAAVEPLLAPDPVEALIARLDERPVTDALHLLLDHADLLAVLVLGLNGLLSRGDTIADSLAGEVQALRGSSASPVDVGQLLDAGRQLMSMTPAFVEKLPVLAALLSSDLADPRLIEVAASASRAVVRGADAAQANQARVSGLRALMRVLKDDDVSRALGFVIAIFKALGQELKSADPAPDGKDR